MATAPTMRANALAIPISHRNDDALDASPAANLFQLDRQIRRAKSIPAPLLERLAHSDGRVRRGAALDLALYDELGRHAFDDGFAVAAVRQFGRKRSPVSRSLRRLTVEGSIEAHRWPWERRKATAYRLRAFAAWLRDDGRLRAPRPDIARLLEAKTSEDRPNQSSEDRRNQSSEDTLSSTPDSLRTQGRSARFHEKIAPDRSKNRPRSTPKPARSAADKESPVVGGEAEVNMRAAMSPASFERLMAANQDLGTAAGRSCPTGHGAAGIQDGHGRALFLMRRVMETEVLVATLAGLLIPE